MSDFVIIDGDEAIFLPVFGKAVVVGKSDTISGTISGSGPTTWNDNALCIEGDEASVKVSDCSYTAVPFCIPGTGILKVDALDSQQVATKTKSGATSVILKGSKFNAVFEVQIPAQKLTAGKTETDPESKYFGKGVFSTSNTKYKGV